ncbi:SAM-dependent methyltransferase [Silvibacterium bohemicum]|uniref:SAM-dependent methyltransferase n=1 Tax=Silvibacterium bohemicum TaxID=1577686 RepID=A0A841JMW9_9BACT|nr:class I SAM-dependent methyltransferase [Silvibacterium bohemicum]MBB6142480.1 SAM-dependent methyltransferase [Silvibacterium bohemicum]
MARSPYNAAFFNSQKDASLISAGVVIPRVLSLCDSKSVADFGCGVGTWLRSFTELGIGDITGIDGEYVSDALLVIPKDHFVRADITQPLELKRTFDLVMSLEVAEHLSNDRATTFIDTLTKHGDVILFSAAIPSQGGTHHVNEQWPQYWTSLFNARGYTCIDCLRDALWDDDRIAWWYRQNMFIFVASHRLSAYPKLMAEAARPRHLPLALVHPGFMYKLEHEQIGVGELVRKIPAAIRTTLSRHSRPHH